jgi:hypothetical protein
MTLEYTTTLQEQSQQPPHTQHVNHELLSKKRISLRRRSLQTELLPLRLAGRTTAAGVVLDLLVVHWRQMQLNRNDRHHLHYLIIER